MLIKESSWFVKVKKYFLQVNDLYKVEEQKVRVNDIIFVGGKSEFRSEFKGYLGKRKEKEWRVRNLNFNCWIHKDGSVLNRDREHQITIIIGPIISKVKLKYYDKIILEANGLSREKELTSRKKLKWIERIHSINKYHKWDYSSSLICYLEENQVQENQGFFVDWFYKFLGETTKR